MKVAIVVPTYNEKENIPPLVKAIFNQSEKVQNHTLYAVIADSFSPDGTGDSVREEQNKYPHLALVEDKRRGIGIGLLTGMQKAFDVLKADAVICMDADFSHDPDDIPRLIAEFDKGADVVIGSRYMKGGGTKNWGIVRKYGSMIVNQYIKTMLGLKPSEITTNFRLFSKKVWEKLDKDSVPWTEKSFLTTPSLLYFVLKAVPEFKEIPILFIDRTRGYSKAQLYTYALAIFKFSLKERKQTILTFFRFLGVGLTGIAVNLVFLYFLVEKIAMHQELASPVAVEASIITNFIFNNFWTFRERDVQSGFLGRFVKYNIISLLGLLITTLVFIFLTRAFNIYYLVAQFIGISLATSWTFFASMKWAWKRN